jgi:hypothetical protein
LLKGSRWLLGSDEYRDQIENRLQEHSVGRRREDLNLRAVRRWERPERVLAHVSEILGATTADLTRKRRDGTQRALAAYALVRRAGLTQRQAADCLGMQTGAAVSMLIRSLKRRMDGEADIRRLAGLVGKPQLSS